MKSESELDLLLLDSLLVAAKETSEQLESLRIKFNREKKKLDEKESLAAEIASRLSELVVGPPGLLEQEEVVKCKDLESLQVLVIQRLVRLWLEQLTPKEEMILRKGYGIGSDQKSSWGDVAKEYGTSPSNIRRLHRKTLEKLRDPSWADRWEHSSMLQTFVKRLDPGRVRSPEEDLLISVYKL